MQTSSDARVRYPRVNLHALAEELEIDLDPAFSQLRDLYTFIDERNTAHTADLDLPCHKGCDACCHESVFLTPVEFFFVWDYVQRELDDATREEIVEAGLELYRRYESLITALDEAPPMGHRDHLEIARKIRFTCPLLGADSACRVYSVRELYARIFGCSFNDEGGVYGCDLVGAHLGGKTVTMVRTRTATKLLLEIPLTFKRQVYPWYINLLYG